MAADMFSFGDRVAWANKVGQVTLADVVDESQYTTISGVFEAMLPLPVCILPMYAITPMWVKAAELLCLSGRNNHDGAE